MSDLDLLVTLWPSFEHFPRFANDSRLAGIRLNSAMMNNPELENELELIRSLNPSVPLYFDVKARQLRVEDVSDNKDHLDLKLNHPIEVEAPVMVLFKAERDAALLERVEDGGRRLIFRGGPTYMVHPGESLHIRHPSLRVHGELFTDAELRKIETVKKAGFTLFFLSFVENNRDIEQFQELVGKDVEIRLKIENERGLDFVAREFRKQPNLILIAARGDLYVEIDRPHHMIEALKLIIAKDPQASVASRILLSVVYDQIMDNIKLILAKDPDASIDSRMLLSMVNDPIPACADFLELAWLYDIGYRDMMLCDEICFSESLLAIALNAFESFRQTYAMSGTLA